MMDCPRQVFVGAIGLLLAMGVLMVHSASMSSRPGDPESQYLSRHLLFVTAGVVVLTAASLVPAPLWRQLAPYVYVITVLALILVLVPGIGWEAKGARRWFRIAGFSLQPSEFAKLTVPLWICRLLDRPPLGGPQAPFLAVLVPLGFSALLVLIEPDLGTALFIVLGGVLTLWVSQWPWRHVGLCAVLSSPLALGLLFLKPYQQARLTGFVTTWLNPDQAPYQVQQALISFGSGGWLGTGLGKGWQKLSFLPEANTDFVFAVLGEELGLLGAFSVIVLWATVYIAGVRMLAQAGMDRFEFRLGFVLLTQIVFQAALNVGIVTALLPPKGISHPLISAGGSNLVSTLLCIGVILSLARPTRLEPPVE